MLIPTLAPIAFTVFLLCFGILALCVLTFFALAVRLLWQVVPNVLNRRQQTQPWQVIDAHTPLPHVPPHTLSH